MKKMQKIKHSFLLILLFIMSIQINNTFAAYSETKRIFLSEEHFKDVIQYILDNLYNENMEINCKKDESGLIHLSFLDLFKVKNISTQIRIEYWKDGLTQEDEELKVNQDIHNHPLYFESYLVKASYEHAIYNKLSDGVEKIDCKDNAEEYYPYELNIRKDEVTKLNPLKLVVTSLDTVKEKAILSFPTSLIHKMTKVKAGTLLINVVFSKVIEETTFLTYKNKNQENYVQAKKTDLNPLERETILKEIELILMNQSLH